MIRKRALALALIALAAPWPAIALDGESGGPKPLTVTASLESCGLAGTQVMCKINAGWNSIEGAETYSVSVTSADGSVIDMGETGGQGTSVWVPYVGSGTYSVSVTAWGTPPGEKDDGTPEVLDRSTSAPEAAPGDAAKTPPTLPAEGKREAEKAGPVAETPPAPKVDEVREVEPACEPAVAEKPPAPAPPREAAEGAEREAAPVQQGVVDTIPADDECTG